MKKSFLFMLMLPMILSCNGLNEKMQGEIRISFDRSSDALTRSGLEIPDTSDFLLSVKDSDGNVIYEGLYCDSPESVTVEEGSYTVRAVSSEFDRPAFSAPQFGDEQCLIVPAGGSVNVRLDCVQLNSGVRLKIDPDFLTAYPAAALMLKSDDGSLLYSYKEKRIAYFKPGKVTLIMSEGARDEVLLSRYLESQEILSLGVSVMSQQADPEASGYGISIAVDTSRYWLDETFVIGTDGGKGGSETEALTVSQAKAAAGEEDVWVSGYIVGGDLTAASASFDEPFVSRTNILLGSRTSTRDRNACMSVQLASGEVRDKLNLVDNPSLKGRKVLLKGDIVEAYYGLVGLKNITDFKVL